MSSYTPTPAGIQPVIMIFDSRPRDARKRCAKKPKKASTAVPGKTFAFVNISRPGKEDEESRRLVKTHVMQDVLRQKSRDCSRFKAKSQEGTTLCLSQASHRSMGSSPQAPPSYLLTFPIQTEPYMLKLVLNYASAMLLTESKVIDSAWFPLIMTDAALFHALLCTSALFGLHDVMVQRKHMLESIRLINDRLPGDGATSDATITAILFMAKAEYFQGNHCAWGVHMDGAKRIVELKGGIATLSRLIKQKIYSTDLLGCMEIGAAPHFPAFNLPKSLSPVDPRNLPPAVLSLSRNFTLDPEFLTLLSEITTHTISSPATRNNSNLQYRLLSLFSTCHYRQPLPNCTLLSKTSCSQAQQTQSETVQKACFIGALLFLSLPHMSALSPIRPVDYNYLLNRLTILISPLFNNHEILRQHPEFLLWLSFLGEIFSSISISLSAYAAYASREFSLFRLQLRRVSVLLEITSWEDARTALRNMWWTFEPRYENLYRHLWEGAVIDHCIAR